MASKRAAIAQLCSKIVPNLEAMVLVTGTRTEHSRRQILLIEHFGLRETGLPGSREGWHSSCLLAVRNKFIPGRNGSNVEEHEDRRASDHCGNDTRPAPPCARVNHRNREVHAGSDHNGR